MRTLLALGLMLATASSVPLASAQVIDRVESQTTPFLHEKTNLTPGNNFRMQVEILVTVKPDAKVTQVDGTCAYTISNRRNEAPAVSVVDRGNGRWSVGFNVPKNDAYYVEIYALTPGQPDPKNKQKKPKPLKSPPLLVEVKL